MGAEEIAPRIWTAAKNLVRWRRFLSKSGRYDSSRRHEITIGCYSSYAHFGAQLVPPKMLLELRLITWRRVDQYTLSIFANFAVCFSFLSAIVQHRRGQDPALVGEKRCCNGALGLLQ